MSQKYSTCENSWVKMFAPSVEKKQLRIENFHFTELNSDLARWFSTCEVFSSIKMLEFLGRSQLKMPVLFQLSTSHSVDGMVPLPRTDCLFRSPEHSSFSLSS